MGGGLSTWPQSVWPEFRLVNGTCCVVTCGGTCPFALVLVTCWCQVVATCAPWWDAMLRTGMLCAARTAQRVVLAHAACMHACLPRSSKQAVTGAGTHQCWVHVNVNMRLTRHIREELDNSDRAGPIVSGLSRDYKFLERNCCILYAENMICSIRSGSMTKHWRTGGLAATVGGQAQ